MRIFLLSLTKDFPAGYDFNCSMIVRANNEDEARHIANSTSQNGDEHIINPNCWLDSDIVDCDEISLAGNPMLILSSPTLPDLKFLDMV